MEKVIEYKNVAALLEYSEPSAYRLAIKLSGEIILQGAYRWEKGTEYGFNWKEIPTVHLED